MGVSRKQKRSFSLLLLSRAAFIFFSFVFLNPGMKKKKKITRNNSCPPPIPQPPLIFCCKDFFHGRWSFFPRFITTGKSALGRLFKKKEKNAKKKLS